VGTVEKIIIVNDSTLRVNMKIDESVKEHIKKDAIASIGSDGIVGDVVVNINWGHGNERAIEDGDVLKTYSRIATADLLKTLGNTNENIAIFSNDLLVIAEKISKGKGTVSMLLNDTILAVEIKNAIINIRTATASLNQTAMQIKSVADQIRHGDGLAASLINDTLTMKRVDGIISRLEESRFYDQLDSAMLYLASSSRNIENLSDELNSLVGEVNQGEGTLGVLLKDSLMAEEFKQTMKNLNQSTLLLNEDLEALQHSFPMKKYFKKQEKEAAKKEKGENGKMQD
jgi:phospholipid/cholesterol/gamma-HCH transport system substrate-binding protein